MKRRKLSQVHGPQAPSDGSTKVEPGSLADQGGLCRGMLISKVDKKPVESATVLRDSLEKASLVLLQTQTPQGGVGYTVLKSEGKS